MRTHQQEFIRTVQAALGKRSSLPPDFFDVSPSNGMETDSHGRTIQEKTVLLERFVQQASAVNMGVTQVTDPAGAALAIRELVDTTQPEWGTEKSVAIWDHLLLNQLELEQVLGDSVADLFITRGPETPDVKTRQAVRQGIIDAYIGITSADFFVAQTATLVLRDRPGQPRAVSLVPSIHVAVVELDQILENLTELYARLKTDPLTNCMSLISGPSKTADIELVMVHGAHGPRQVHVIVVTG